MIPKKCIKCPFKRVRETAMGNNKICLMCDRDGLNGIVDFNEKIKGWGDKIRKDRIDDQKFISEITTNYFNGNCMFSVSNTLDSE